MLWFRFAPAPRVLHFWTRFIDMLVVSSSKSRLLMHTFVGCVLTGSLQPCTRCPCFSKGVLVGVLAGSRSDLSLQLRMLRFLEPQHCALPCCATAAHPLQDAGTHCRPAQLMPPPSLVNRVVGVGAVAWPQESCFRLALGAISSHFPAISSHFPPCGQQPS